MVERAIQQTPPLSLARLIRVTREEPPSGILTGTATDSLAGQSVNGVTNLLAEVVRVALVVIAPLIFMVLVALVFLLPLLVLPLLALAAAVAMTPAAAVPMVLAAVTRLIVAEEAKTPLAGRAL